MSDLCVVFTVKEELQYLFIYVVGFLLGFGFFSVNNCQSLGGLIEKIFLININKCSEHSV